MTPLKPPGLDSLSPGTAPPAARVDSQDSSWQHKPWEPDCALPYTTPGKQIEQAALLSHLSAAQHASLLRRGSANEAQQPNAEFTRRVLLDTLQGLQRWRPDIDLQSAEVGAAMRMLHVEGAAVLEVRTGCGLWRMLGPYAPERMRVRVAERRRLLPALHAAVPWMLAS